MDTILHGLLRQPHAVEVLVHVVARANLPPSYDRTMWDDPVKPQGDEHVRLLVEDSFLVLPHEPPLLRGIGRAIKRKTDRKPFNKPSPSSTY